MIGKACGRDVKTKTKVRRKDSQVKDGMKCLPGRGNSTCKALMEKMIISKTLCLPGVLKSNSYNSPVR